jgi:hypothetical protein
MLLRSLGVITFIAIVGATGVYFAQRPTVAQGDVIAAELMKSNESVKAVTCDKHIPIGLTGATFHCGVEFKNGGVARMKFIYDRNGSITQAANDPTHEPPADQPPVEKTSDPWGD